MSPSRLPTFMHANTRHPNSRSQQRRSRGGVSSSVDSRILRDEIETGSLSTTYPDDISQRPINGLISQRPPRSLGNQIFWFKSATSSPLTLSSGSVPNENNFTFNASTINGFSVYALAFDQYCLYSIVAVLTLGNTSGVSSIIAHTAIDYDIISNLGSLTALEAYTSHHATQLTSAGTSVVRYIKPCTAPLALNSGTAQPALVMRNWLDTNYNAVVHYGLRTMFELGTATAPTVNVQFTYIVGFRNAI
jgi:hypothetical protein